MPRSTLKGRQAAPPSRQLRVWSHSGSQTLGCGLLLPIRQTCCPAFGSPSGSQALEIIWLAALAMAM